MKNLNKQPLIEVRKLKKFFPLKKTSIFQRTRLNVRAVEDVTFTIYKGETFGLVGESGCGKSTLGRTILQLYPPTSGSALYYGIPLHEVNPKYVLEEIDKLTKYQSNASKDYQKSLVYDQKIEEVKKQIVDFDTEENRKEAVNQLEEYNKELKVLKDLEQAAVNELSEALEKTITDYKDLLVEKPYMHVEKNWEEDVRYVINLVKEDSNNSAIPDRIELLHAPHRNALAAYKKLEAVCLKLRKHEAKKSLIGVNVNLQKRLKAYQEKSKELKKNASRNLREGSRTAGEFILEADLPTIAQLMKEEELLAREIYQLKNEIKELNKKENNLRLHLADLKAQLEAAQSTLKANKVEGELTKEVLAEIAKTLNKDEVKNVKDAYHKVHNLPAKIADKEKELEELSKERPEKIAEIQKLIDEKTAARKDLHEKIETYRGKNVLPITERCLDPEYQAKMERNREYAINLQRLKKEEMRVLRQKLQMIFQDPYSSLDPRMTVGQAISEAVIEHGLYKEGTPELENYIIDIMAKCGLDHYMIHRYPHQFSGGQRQRIVIARALALQPEFVVCDESVSALDVSIQSQILNLLQDLKEDRELTYLFISHDLSVIKHVSDRIGVMYLGDMVELCESDTLYENPLHPYSKSLISAIPTTTQDKKSERIILKGEIPSNIFPPSGCKFRTRCPLARGKCAKEKPELREVEPGHQVACHFYEETRNIV